MAKLKFYAGAAVSPFYSAVVAARENAQEGPVEHGRAGRLLGIEKSLGEAIDAFQRGRGVPFPDGFEVEVLVSDLAEIRRVLEQAEDDARTEGFKPGPGLSRASYLAERPEDAELFDWCVMEGEVEVVVSPEELGEAAFHEAVRFIQSALGVESGDAAASWFHGGIGDTVRAALIGYARFEQVMAESNEPGPACPCSKWRHECGCG